MRRGWRAALRMRLDPRLPAAGRRLRDGYYSDAYFVYTKQLLEERTTIRGC